MKRRIIIDALSLLAPLTGIGRYTYELAKVLREKDDFCYDYFYGYVSRVLINPTDAPAAKSLRSVVVKNPWIKSLVRRVMFQMSGILSPRYDLYWQPNFIPNTSIKADKTVVSVHDFSWEIYPDFQPKERVQYFQTHFYQLLPQCDHIITGTEFSKQEIIERTHISAEKISVIYHGINHAVFYPRTLDNIEQKYILAVGSLEPRKNLKNLLLAYSMLEQNTRDTYHLILVGAAGWNNHDIVNLIESLKTWVHYSGYVSDEQLAELYTQADLFIYPSIYEGFGIPPLEAMACGTPVIVSQASTLPEVCQDAAYYIDPYDIYDIKEKIESVLSSEGLQQELKMKGIARAKLFSWEKSAQEHREVFQKVLKQ